MRFLYLPEDEGFLVVDRVETVVWHHASPELFPDRVRRKAVHVNLNVRPYLLVRQKLTGYDLCEERSRSMWGRSTWFKVKVIVRSRLISKV